MKNGIKNTYICPVIIILLMFLTVFTVYWSHTAFYNTESLKQDVVGTNKKLDSIFMITPSIEAQKQIEDSIESYYNNITTNTINRINCAIGILAAAASLFAAFGICISLINIYAFKEIEKKANKVEDLEKRIGELKVMQYLVLGKLYEYLL